MKSPHLQYDKKCQKIDLEKLFEACKSIFVGASPSYFLHQTRVSAEQHNQKSTSTYRTNRNAPILRLERSTTSPTNLCAFLSSRYNPSSS